MIGQPTQPRKATKLMRDRLIAILDEYGDDISFCDICDRPTEDCEACKNEQLADYLLANGVIVPPCDFLQKVYVLPTIENNLCDITEMKCIGFILSHDNYNVNLIDSKNKLYQPAFGRFGKTVFLTKEEAEQALKGGAE